MSQLTLEERVQALEQAVAAMQPPGVKIIGPSPYSKWWEKIPPSTFVETDEERAMSEAVTMYIRQTGDAPPLGWKPGDPIPEPEHWK